MLHRSKQLFSHHGYRRCRYNKINNKSTVDNQLDVGNLSITGNTISITLDTISFASSKPIPIYNSKLQVDDLQLTGNTISTTVPNPNLELPNGSGTLEVIGNTNIPLVT